MQAREYMPQVGRFTTPDRFESASADFGLQSDALTQDRYAFAGGNPVNNVEADGHGPCHSRADCPDRVSRDNSRANHAPRSTITAQTVSAGRESTSQRHQAWAWQHAGQRACWKGVCQRQPIPPAMARLQAPPPAVHADEGVVEQQGAQVSAAMNQPKPEDQCDITTCSNPVRSEAREAEVKQNQAQLFEMVVGDPLHNPLDAISWFPGFGELRVLHAADEFGHAASAGEKLTKAEGGGLSRTRSTLRDQGDGTGGEPDLIYEHNPKHGPVARQGPNGEIRRAPRGDCQAMLECSTQLGPRLRSGVEPETGLEVIFRQHRVFGNTEWWHGYVPGG